MDVSAAAATAITVAEVEVTVQIDCPLGAGHEQLHLEVRFLRFVLRFVAFL